MHGPSNSPGIGVPTAAPIGRIDKYLPAIVGALFLAIGDLLTNDTAATVIKIVGAIKKLAPVFGGGAFSAFLAANGGYIAFLILMTGAWFLAWLKSPGTKFESFTLGMSVFTTLFVISPYKVLKAEADAQTHQQSSQQESSNHVDSRDWSFLIYEAAAQIATEERPFVYSDKTSNGRISQTVNVSSCKPHYVGPFGISSYINNSIAVCYEGDSLQPETKVRILECWDTDFRNYRYTRIGYEIGGTSKTGWIADGRVPDVWRNIEPTDKTSLPKSCEPSGK